MAEPKVTLIKKELSRRCGLINKRDGYYTDIGKTVKRGPIDFDKDDLPAICIMGGEIEGVARQVPGQLSGLPIVIEAHAFIQLADHPEDLADQMIQDITDAIEQSVSMQDIKAAVIKRPPEYVGSQIVYPQGPREIVSVSVQYQINFSRGYGKTTN